MNLATLEMTPRQARTEAERYAKCENLTVKDKHIMAAYRSIAHGGKVIALAETLRKAWLNDSGLPKLAICRADAERVTLQFFGGGQMQFTGDVGHWHKRDVITGNFTTYKNRETISAYLPYIPPYIRIGNMSDYFVLWEANWKARPKPSDPFLLKRLDDNLFRIVSAWDISPVEAAAIS